MKLDKISLALLSLIVTAALVGLLTSRAEDNWLWRARASLFARGHLFSELKVPEGPDRELLGHKNEFISNLVYQHGVLIGYLDPYGHFVRKTELGANSEVEGRITFCLWALQFICWGLVLLALVGLLLRFRHARGIHLNEKQVKES